MNFQLRNQWIRSTAIVIALLLIWAAKKWFESDPKTSEDNLQQPIQVQVVQVKTAPMPEQIETVAVLKAKQEVRLTNQVAGQVESILVQSGVEVQAGQPLVRLRPDFVIKSPIRGVLGDWKVHEGSYLPIGTELIHVINPSELQVDYGVPENFAAKLAVGQPVQIKIRAFPKEVFQGKTEFIAPFVRKEDHSILVRAIILNSEKKLLPGLFVEATHVLQEYPEARVIPEASFIQLLDGFKVYKIEKDKAKLVPVILGNHLEGRVHVVSGLEVGDSVVMTRSPLLFDGSSVVAHVFEGTW